MDVIGTAIRVWRTPNNSVFGSLDDWLETLLTKNDEGEEDV